MTIIRNKYVQIVILCVVCFVIGYFYKDEKIITKEVIKKEYVKGKIVKVESHGVTTTTTDFTSSTDTNSFEKTEINKKRIGVQAGYLVGHSSQAFQASILSDVINNIGIGLVYQYNITNKNNMGGVLIQARF